MPFLISCVSEKQAPRGNPGDCFAGDYLNEIKLALGFFTRLRQQSNDCCRSLTLSGYLLLSLCVLAILTPAIFYVLIVSLINSFQLFPQIMIMTDGGPNGATQVMVERIYKYGFRYFKMGYASAFSWILFLIIMVCTAIQMRGQKRWVNYDA